MTNLLSPAGRAALVQLLEEPHGGAVFGFDFDGTLAPIRARPDEVTLDERTAGLFAALTRLLPVAVITGRSVADVGPRLAGTPRWIVGNHGAEGMPGTDAAALAAQARTCTAWRAQLGQQPDGVFVEDKQYTLSIHYRQAADHDAARQAIARQLAGLSPAPHVVDGKCVFNLLPAGSMDKFMALRTLAAGAPAFFIGDDVTDELVFRQAPASWVTVKVGTDGPTAARFSLAGQDAVADCLDLLRELAGSAASSRGRMD